MYLSPNTLSGNTGFITPSPQPNVLSTLFEDSTQMSFVAVILLPKVAKNKKDCPAFKVTVLDPL